MATTTTFNFSSLKIDLYIFKRQPHKVVKHTTADELFEVFDHFVGLATKVLNLLIHTYDQDKTKKHNTKIKFQQICSFRLYRFMICMTRKNTLLLLSSRLILSLSACLFMVKDIQRSN